MTCGPYCRGMAKSRSPMDRMLGAIVPRAVDAIDPDELIDQIDLDRLLARTDLNALLERLDLELLLQRIDINAIVSQVDINSIVSRVDINEIVARVDINEIVAKVDVDTIISKVDVNGIVAKVDVNEIVSKVDINGIVSQVDVATLINQVDVDSLIQDVDVDALVQRIDLDALVARLDMDSVLASVDIKSLVARAGIDEAIAQTATGLMGRSLDVGRRKVYRLDGLLLSAVDRMMGRKGDKRLVPELGSSVAAGPIARTLAFFADAAVMSVGFSMFVTVAANLVGLFTGHDFDTRDDGGPIWAAAFFGSWFLYLWAAIGVGGRTVGKGLLGIRVVGADMAPATSKAAFGRAVAFPFSFVLGLGFIPAVLAKRRRAFHDLVGGTQEVVDDEVSYRYSGQMSGI